MLLRVDPAMLREPFKAARPFPHVAIDGLFEDPLLETLLAEFPSPGQMRWQRFDSPLEKKLGFHYALSELGEATRSFLWEMNSPPMLEFLECLTGIDGLIPDPYFGGGGLHQVEPGGFLKLHSDFNVHPKLRLDRRLNLLIYLNRQWLPEYGGDLELWSPGGQRPEVSIPPLFNRTVIFATTDASLHGHPHPLRSPQGVTRKSVSLYYYTNGRPESERSLPHDTLFAPEGR